MGTLVPANGRSVVANPLEAAAYQYALLKTPVSPLCHPTTDGNCGCGKNHSGQDVGKAPKTRRGHKDASATIRQIWDWWHQWPDANIGINLEAAGLVVVAPDSPVWDETFKQRGLPETATVQSGGGQGHLHYYFLRPVDCPQRRITKSGEYDILSLGYVVAPPSRHRSGRRYEWITGLPRFIEDLPFAPDWVVNELKQAANSAVLVESRPLEMAQEPAERPPVVLDKFGVRWWNGEQVKRRTPGTIDRSATLMTIASCLGEAGATEDQIAEALAERDCSLGYQKYTKRKDSREYWRMAQKAIQSVESGGSSGLIELQNLTELPPENPRGQDEELLGQQDAPSVEKPLFLTARQATEQTPQKPTGIAPPWVHKGVITELDGKIKSAGKTTFMLAMVKKVLDGKPFLGRATKKTNVVILTEQTPTTFCEALKRAGQQDREDLHVLFYHKAFGMTWPAVIKATIEYARKLDAEFLVVDTLGHWAGLKDSDENQAGPAMEALKPLQIAAALGFGLLVIRHDRKGGGEVGESARGSSAFGGGVDTILRLKRGEGRTSPTVRIIEGISRLDGVPDEIAIDYVGGEYKLLGDTSEVGRRQARQAILTHLPGSVEKAVTTNELIELADINRTYLARVIKVLFDEGWIQRIGTGTRNHAYQYWIEADTRDELLAKGGEI